MIRNAAVFCAASLLCAHAPGMTQLMPADGVATDEPAADKPGARLTPGNTAPTPSSNDLSPPPARAVLLPPDGVLASGMLRLERDTMVRLMVTKEVNSRTAQQGDRFNLRVDEAVTVAGQTLIPVGARAVGEVMSAEGTGGLGKAGRLGARLLHLEIGDAQIPLSGEEQAKGARSTDRVVISALTFGVLGLFTKGNNAKLKAGDIINGFITEDMIFDPATKWFSKAVSVGATSERAVAATSQR